MSTTGVESVHQKRERRKILTLMGCFCGVSHLSIFYYMCFFLAQAYLILSTFSTDWSPRGGLWQHIILWRERVIWLCLMLLKRFRFQLCGVCSNTFRRIPGLKKEKKKKNKREKEEKSSLFPECLSYDWNYVNSPYS